MLTVNEVVEWLAKKRLTCKDLAQKIDANYYHLAAVLRGERPLTTKMQRAIEEFMQQEGKGLTVAIPPEYEELLTVWASVSGLTVEDLVVDLLGEALRLRRPTAGRCARLREDGLPAADDSAPE